MSNNGHKENLSNTIIKETENKESQASEVSDSEFSEEEPALSKSELRKTILSFTWPCLAELMLISMISVVNQAMVGHLGSYALSAVGLTNQPVLVSVAVFQAFNVGATALVARFIGAKEHEKAKTVVIQTLIISVISGIILSLIGFNFSNWIVVKMGASPDTVQYAEMYMKYMSIGMIFQAIPTAITSLLRGAGDTRSPMRYNIISNIVNVVAGVILIHGVGSYKGMGLEGAAIAATLAKLSACILSIIALFRTHLPVAIRRGDKFKLDFSIIGRIMNIGGAAAGEQLAMRLGFIVYTRIIAELGTVPFAAHQIIISINGLSFNVGQALGLSATSYMGRFLGAKKPETAEIYVKELRRIAMFASIFICATFFFGGQYIARLFTNELPVIGVTAVLLKILVFMVPAQNSQLVLSGGLRGAGDTKWTLISTTSGVLLVRVPLVILFIKLFNLGIEFAWVAAVIDQYVRSTVVYTRFIRGKWKLVEV